MTQDTTPSTHTFGPVHTIEPKSAHTFTVIMLHGRGSDGEEFAEQFSSSHLSNRTSLIEAFPGLRWVFPSSQKLWSSSFQETIPAWFEAPSLTDITAKQELQIDGITDSVRYVQLLIETEIAIVNGNGKRVLIGGMSQGGATGLWTLLARGPEPGIGAFFAASTWSPFPQSLKQFFSSERNQKLEKVVTSPVDSFINTTLAEYKETPHGSQRKNLPKIFLGHGVDDTWIDLSLGEQARDVLRSAGFDVQWKTYTGAEMEGHWFKVPEEMDDIHHFIQNYISHITI